MLGISLLLPCSRSSAQTLPNYLPTDGLVGWWPFNGNANDESGNGNDGIAFETSTGLDRWSVPGPILFNGTGSQVVVANSVDFLSSALTLSTWVMPLRDDACIVKKSNVTNAGELAFSLTFNDNWNGQRGIRSIFGSNSCDPPFDSAQDWSSYGAAQVGIWSHIVVTIDASGLVSHYINGELIFSTVRPPYVGCNSPTSTLRFGGAHWNNDPEWFEGAIDDIGIWNRALTDAEVMALYLGEPPVAGCINPTACNFNPEANVDDGSCVAPSCNDPVASNYNGESLCGALESCVYLPGYVPSEGLVGWWPFNGNANDESGNGNHGSVQSGASLAMNRFNQAESAFEIDGINCSGPKGVSIPANLINSEYAISLWAKSNDSTKVFQTVLNSFPHAYVGLSLNYPLAATLNRFCSFYGNGSWLLSGIELN